MNTVIHSGQIGVELLNTMGDDLAIVNAARVSYARQSEVLSDSDRGLINYLMRERHGTPFEMVQFQFRVHVPIGVGREWLRHRIGSFNEISTRYVQMEPEFYLPEGEHVRTQVGKPGYYTFEPLSAETTGLTHAVMQAAYQRAYDNYEALLRLGVAKELARNVLPLGLFTTLIWSVNLRSLFNFLSLRTAPNALLEIRLAAQQVEQLACPVAPVAFEAWEKNGRVAP